MTRLFALGVLIAVPVLFGSLIAGVGSLPLIFSFLPAPAGLFLLVSYGRGLPFLSGIAVIGMTSLGALVVYLTEPARAPLIEVWLASSCTAIATFGICLYFVGENKQAKAWYLAIALISILVSMIQFAVIGYAAPDYSAAPIAGLFEGLFRGLFVGLPFLLVTALFGWSASVLGRVAYVVGTALVCLLAFGLSYSFLHPPYALLSEIHLADYQLILAFDESAQSFIGHEAIAGDFEWHNDRDVLYAQDGSLAPWSEQTAMQAALRHVGLEGYSVEAIFEKPSSNNPLHAIKVNVRLSRDHLALQPRKKGLLSYESQFRLPLALGLTPAVFAPGPRPNIEIQVTTPQDFGLKTNLDAQSRDTILPDGGEGVVLRSGRVDDLWAVVRLRYPIRLFRNPILANVVKISGTTVVLALQAMICGALGFWLAIATDLIKEKRLKPATERFLTRIRLLRRPHASQGDVD